MRLARARRRLRAALAGPDPERKHPEAERSDDMMWNGATTR